MGTLAIERTVAAPPRRVWDVITDWSGHSRRRALTTMRLDRGPTRLGWSFAGLTGVDWLRLTDLVLISAWAPPAQTGDGGSRLVKLERALASWAKVSVLPVAGGQPATLMLRENIVLRLAILGLFPAPLAACVSQARFAGVIDPMATRLRSPGRLASGHQ
jgi:hypothetical protein